jgi:hypothetical protein
MFRLPGCEVYPRFRLIEFKGDEPEPQAPPSPWAFRCGETWVDPFRANSLGLVAFRQSVDYTDYCLMMAVENME